MNKVWVFIKLENSEIVRLTVYGSITELCNVEKVKIKGKILTENMIRRLLAQKQYIDSNYYIEQLEVHRSKQKQ